MSLTNQLIKSSINNDMPFCFAGSLIGASLYSKNYDSGGYTIVISIDLKKENFKIGSIKSDMSGPLTEFVIKFDIKSKSFKQYLKVLIG